jgi:PIN domain nuclease of toxin-antitoxin system
MKVLLDTHAFLWFVTADPRLGPFAKAYIEDPSNQRLLSTASLWEMAIKFSLGKLKLTKPFAILIPEQLTANGVEILPIQLVHIEAVSGLPFHHRDPFDRLLMAQAIVEGIVLLSSETVFDAYGVKRVW